ncbi:hypothetical protein K466DRAFT_583993 [Polyporus arcularius HHB13444]|uniref:Uncharacterized protein n=1 Tax=Polyporus arcularius HHB13444 TaxID=1314778 RepID=A0A5C3PPE4_9APHY|nr:hypothetical protein K466DRAFT_583993 [Polyporus arcularius HHB13444]
MTATAHNRSNSTPSLKPALDHMSSEPWLVASKAKVHSPRVSDAVIQGDKEDMVVDHLSFFADAPLQTSTPPRRRRSATVGVWAHGLMPQLDADPPLPVRSLRYDSDVDMSDSSLPGSPSDSISSRAKPPRRRRRTIVHLSSDSLFSSSMDFSALMSETERFPRPPASEGCRSPADEYHTGDVDLAPAFSLSSSPVQSMRSDVSGRPLSKSSLRISGPTSSVSFSSHQPGVPPSSPSSCAPPAQASPDPEGDELLDLFSVLGLDEDEEKWNTAVDPDDSGVAFSMSRSRSHDSNLSSSSTRVRRKRGDTIRASDYPKVPGLSSSFDSASAAGVGRPRRTRSGTVTQVDTAGARRKHDGRPTIKMRTNTEPLRADGNEDDELLLKDGDVIE